jgi:hypothetical protein
MCHNADGADVGVYGVGLEHEGKNADVEEDGVEVAKRGEHEPIPLQKVTVTYSQMNVVRRPPTTIYPVTIAGKIHCKFSESALPHQEIFWSSGVFSVSEFSYIRRLPRHSCREGRKTAHPPAIRSLPLIKFVTNPNNVYIM